LINHLQSKQNTKKGKEGDGIRQRKKEMLASGYRLILTTLWGLPNQTQSEINVKNLFCDIKVK